MRSVSIFFVLAIAFLLAADSAVAGPYTESPIGNDDPSIVGWATGYLNYEPADGVEAPYNDPTKALGKPTGDVTKVVSLGESLIGSGVAPGQITMTFDAAIKNRPGYDLAVWENGFYVSGSLWYLELAYVEVSTDGVHFARFPSVSLTAAPIGAYGELDPTNLHNLAGGKGQNAYGISQGTPFDLDDLAKDPLVAEGLVDLDNIRFVRIVDVPGGGAYSDDAEFFGYAANHPIYDPYPTIAPSAGFDLGAVAILDESNAGDDDDNDNDDNDDNDASPPWRGDDDAAGASPASHRGGCGS
jgi:hypothetical protein